MALATHLSLTDLFWTSATNDAATHPNTEVAFTVYELNSDITNSATVTPEGIVLALLQKWNAAQGTDAARRLEVSESQSIVSRGGDSVYCEQFIVRIYSGSTPVSPMDPDDV